jgi:hypothetical protein
MTAPRKDDAPEARGIRQTTHLPESLHSAPAAADPQSEAEGRAAVELRDKEIAYWIARAAMAGICVHIVSAPGGGSQFLAARWSHTRFLPDLDALRRWLEQVEGKRP